MFSCPAHAAEPRPQIVHTRRSRAHESGIAAKPPSRVRAPPVRCPYLPCLDKAVPTRGDLKERSGKQRSDGLSCLDKAVLAQREGG